VTKAELRAAYKEVRGKFADGEFLANEYVLHLDEMLSDYFGMPMLDYETEVAEG
jgi:hypothetical protein